MSCKKSLHSSNKQLFGIMINLYVAYEDTSLSCQFSVHYTVKSKTLQVINEKLQRGQYTL